MFFTLSESNILSISNFIEGLRLPLTEIIQIYLNLEIILNSGEFSIDNSIKR